MKTFIQSTLTLEEVAEHFEHWRQNKKKGERIPDQLWREAGDLLGRYGITQVTQTLRLSSTDFKKRRAIAGTERRVSARYLLG